jgi:hypothetical protein
MMIDDYQPPHYAKIIRAHRDEFDKAIRQAYRGDTVALCNYIRDGMSLDEDQRDMLATLIARRVGRGSDLGRRPGRTPISLIDRKIIAHAMPILRRMRQRLPDGKRRLPKGKIDKVIKEAMQSVNVDGDDEIPAKLRRDVLRAARPLRSNKS